MSTHNIPLFYRRAKIFFHYSNLTLIRHSVAHKFPWFQRYSSHRNSTAIVSDTGQPNLIELLFAHYNTNIGRNSGGWFSTDPQRHNGRSVMVFFCFFFFSNNLYLENYSLDEVAFAISVPSLCHFRSASIPVKGDTIFLINDIVMEIM